MDKKANLAASSAGPYRWPRLEEVAQMGGGQPRLRSWDLSAADRYRRGETDMPSSEAYNPFRRH
jgi:hypothetical protein